MRLRFVERFDCGGFLGEGGERSADVVFWVDGDGVLGYGVWIRALLIGGVGGSGWEGVKRCADLGVWGLLELLVCSECSECLDLLEDSGFLEFVNFRTGSSTSSLFKKSILRVFWSSN